MRTARYGVGVRNRLDDIRKMRTQKYKCPRCKKTAMKRLYSGVWRCKRCDLEIADNAYSLSIKAL
ncbi:MAG: hypothetical protein M1348_00050 [Candidatus Parvarchaeota archaeon]|jgi:Ribosomal protein L37AE/L43A|nr:hypothetical protein [Candidatus Parvarchaeota archaeon]MCL5100991.1 hypothetical protein [Candidatus Parvarchaeota archaeon]